jgi:hypothetical protein
LPDEWTGMGLVWEHMCSSGMPRIVPLAENSWVSGFSEGRGRVFTRVFICVPTEALVHEHLFLFGAATRPVRCSCNRCHREFFSAWIAGGFDGVVALIEYLLAAMGVLWTK